MGVLTRVRLRSGIAACLPVLLLATWAHASTSLCGQVRTNLRMLRAAVRTYQLDHDERIPTDGVEGLVAAGLIDPASPRIDPWGNPYVILATANDVTVTTVGPDHDLGTADDFSTASSTCPSWPSPDSTLRLRLAAIGTVAALGVAFWGWSLARRRSAKRPRTSVN